MEMDREHELQVVYGFSPREAQVYNMKMSDLSGIDIADTLGLAPQTVANIFQTCKQKIKEKSRPIQIVVVNQVAEAVTRRATAMFCLMLIALDNRTDELYEGTHTLVLNGIPSYLGDADWVYQNVFTSIDILCNNDREAKDKARKAYQIYLEKGGEKGKLGYGFIIRVFTQFFIKYDIFSHE